MNEPAVREPRKTSRRAFLKGAGIAAAFGASCTLLFRLGRKDEFLAGAVRRKLPYLDVPHEDLARFAADFYTSAGVGQRRIIAFIALLAPLYRALEAKGRSTPLADLEERAAQTFLLSSDLFARGGDLSRGVRYVRLYDPYVLPCADPFGARGRR